MTGKTLGSYRILDRLGAGGMGEVWRAHHPQLGRDVAIKILPPGHDTARFALEAKTLAALNHPNIVMIFDVGTADGIDYFVSELVPGQSLREILRSGAFTPRRALDLAAQIAEGVAAAHSKNITHRDLKPENVMVTPDERAKVLDFGLAKRAAVAAGADSETLTEHGTVMGTVGYMSPEQARGEECDARSDLFSFGAVLYEILSGRRAFHAPTAPETMTAILREDPAPLPEAVAAPLRQIVGRCLEKAPSRRYQSAADLAFALRNLSSEPSAPTVKVAPAPPPKPKHRWSAAAIAAALVAGFLLRHALLPEPQFPASAVHLTSLTTEERTESNPEFSPDGKMIAFTTREGLRVRTLSGPASEPIAPFQGLGSITWMPDGSRILYSRGGGVWSVTAAGGTPQPVLERAGNSFALSPDGKHLLVAERASATLWRILDSSPPGATPRPLAAFPVAANGDFAFGRFAPDGTKYFVAIGGRGPDSQRWVMPFPSGKPREVPQFRAEFNGIVRGPSWFPDSRHAVNSIRRDGDQVLIADTASAAPPMVLLNSAEDLYSSTLSPDGKRLVFAAAAQYHAVLEYDLDAKRESRVAGGKNTARPGNWTEDGSRLVWLAGRAEGDRIPRTLHFRTPAGEQSVSLESRDGMSNPRISPDGRRVAYTATEALWVFAPGARPIRLAHAPFGATPGTLQRFPPCWSFDSTQLAYVRRDGADLWLETVSSGGGTPRRLAKGYSSDCAWSRDGRWIALFGRGVRLVEVATGEVRTLSELDSLAGVFGAKGQLYLLYRGGRETRMGEFDVPSGRILRSEELALDARGARYFSVHPSGRRIVYQRVNRPFALWMMDMPRPATGIERLWRKWNRPEPRQAPVSDDE